MDPLEVLTRPLRPDEVAWKIISVKDGWTTIAPYVDARVILDRLDAAFGPFGWQVRYTPARVGEENGVIASILIRDPATGEWIEKQDGSDASDKQPFKGGISGALKRAAVAWGIGRDLYRYPRVTIRGDLKFIPQAVLKKLEEITEAVAQGRDLPETIRLDVQGQPLTLQGLPRIGRPVAPAL
jgi:hypothetical protein